MRRQTFAGRCPAGGVRYRMMPRLFKLSVLLPVISPLIIAASVMMGRILERYNYEVRE